MSGELQSTQRSTSNQPKKVGGFTGRGFMPGKSGNPSGRPAKQIDVEKLAKEQTPAAIAALVAALKSPRERVPAAIALLNRGWGMPKQNISGDKNAPLIVDFRWADNTSVNTDTVIDAVTEQIAPLLTYKDDDNGEG